MSDPNSDFAFVFLTETQLADRQQRSVKTLQNQRVAGTGIPFVRFGSSVRYRLSDVEAYEAANRFSSTTCRTDTAA